MTAVACMVIGCRDVTPPINDFATARQRWEAAGRRTYNLTIRGFCLECDGRANQWAIVVVEDGRVTSRTFLNSGLPVDPDLFPVFSDVEGLFDLIIEAYDRDYHSIIVEYDQDAGYPREIRIKRFAVAPDDGYGWKAIMTPR